MAVPPRIKPRLKILEPITFPMDISVCWDIAALMVTANSGADVPKATTVSPIIKSDTFRVCAISEAESTNQSAPFQSMIIEKITRIQSRIIYVSMSPNNVILQVRKLQKFPPEK